MGQRPHSPVPVTHVGVAEEAILGGDGTADRGSIELLHRCSQDEGAGLPESLGTRQMGGKQQIGGGKQQMGGGNSRWGGGTADGGGGTKSTEDAGDVWDTWDHSRTCGIIAGWDTAHLKDALGTTGSMGGALGIQMWWTSEIRGMGDAWDGRGGWGGCGGHSVDVDW